MPSYKPATYDDAWQRDFGYLLADFEAFEPNPNYKFPRPPPSKDAWKIMKPKHAPAIPALPAMIERVIASSWKIAEPAAGASRNTRGIIMGDRGGVRPSAVPVQQYHAQVRPTTPNINTSFPTKTSIAADWFVFRDIERTNAVAFRGDTRPPLEVIYKCGGFGPPISRPDRYYLENNVFDAFGSYLKRRYGCALSKSDFLRALDTAAPSEADKRLLVDYMMWRKICEREAFHMGRMVENECLKGYVSTSRAIDSSTGFGTAYNSKPGWLYVVIVHAGFIVPWGKKAYWGSEEAEIAQWGPIPAERVVACVHLNRFNPEGPIFVRRSFRKKESKACDYMFDVMSGMTP